MRRLFVNLALYLFPLGLFAQDLFPTSTTNQVVDHTYYSFSYSEDHEQAEWVYYMLTGDMVRSGSVSRTDNFR